MANEYTGAFTTARTLLLDQRAREDRERLKDPQRIQNLRQGSGVAPGTAADRDDRTMEDLVDRGESFRWSRPPHRVKANSRFEQQRTTIPVERTEIGPNTSNQSPLSEAVHRDKGKGKEVDEYLSDKETVRQLHGQPKPPTKKKTLRPVTKWRERIDEASLAQTIKNNRKRMLQNEEGSGDGRNNKRPRLAQASIEDLDHASLPDSQAIWSTQPKDEIQDHPMAEIEQAPVNSSGAEDNYRAADSWRAGSLPSSHGSQPDIPQHQPEREYWSNGVYLHDDDAQIDHESEVDDLNHETPLEIQRNVAIVRGSSENNVADNDSARPSSPETDGVVREWHPKVIVLRPGGSYLSKERYDLACQNPDSARQEDTANLDVLILAPDGASYLQPKTLRWIDEKYKTAYFKDTMAKVGLPIALAARIAKAAPAVMVEVGSGVFQPAELFRGKPVPASIPDERVFVQEVDINGKFTGNFSNWTSRLREDGGQRITPLQRAQLGPLDGANRRMRPRSEPCVQNAESSVVGSTQRTRQELDNRPRGTGHALS